MSGSGLNNVFQRKLYLAKFVKLTLKVEWNSLKKLTAEISLFLFVLSEKVTDDYVDTLFSVNEELFIIKSIGNTNIGPRKTQNVFRVSKLELSVRFVKENSE